MGTRMRQGTVTTDTAMPEVLALDPKIKDFINDGNEAFIKKVAIIRANVLLDDLDKFDSDFEQWLNALTPAAAMVQITKLSNETPNIKSLIEAKDEAASKKVVDIRSQVSPYEQSIFDAKFYKWLKTVATH